MKKNTPRMRKESGGPVIGLARVLIVLLFGLSSLCGAAWNYGYWKEATSYADIKEAMAEAQASKRPLLVALSKPGEQCSNCLNYWRKVACDGVFHHDKNCGVASQNHPIVAYAQEKKVVMVYFTPSAFTNLAGKFTGKEYETYLHKPAYFPIYVLLKVKEEDKLNLNSVPEDENILNVGNTDVGTPAGDKVEFIMGYIGIGGKPVYDYQGNDSGLKVKADDTGWKVFKSNIESIFSDPTKTRGLTLDPPQDTEEGYTNAETLEFDGDNQVYMKNNLQLAKDQTESWFKFQADAGKKYWFKTSAAARGTTTDGLTFDFYKSTGSGDSLAPTGNPLESTSDEDGFALDIKTWSGTVFLKLSRATAASAYTYNMKYRRTTNTAGGSISTASDSVTAGKWTTNYTSAKNAGKPMVVAFVKDLWSEDAQALDAYVQTATFTSAFGSTNYVLIRGAVEGITPDCSSVELFYLRNDGSIVGRLTNQVGFVPAEEGTVATVADFTGANANVFPQFKTIATEAAEEANNTTGGAVDIIFEEGVLTANLSAKLGGVDAIDWYDFETADTSETWILTFSSASAGNVSVSLTNADGDEKASVSGDLKNGVVLNFKPESTEELMYLKVTANGIASPIDYTLSVERKIVHYTVEFENATKRPLLSSGIVEIPVTLKENLAKAGSVSVKVVMTAYDNNLRSCNLRTAIDDEEHEDYEQTLTWTDAEKVTTPTKSLWLTLESKKDWEGHKDVTLELTEISDNAALGETKNMTVEVFSKADQAMFEDGDAVSLDLEGEGGDAGAAILNIAAPETTGVFWELVAGEIPEGLAVNVRKSGDNYELKMTPGDIALGAYSFSVKLYTIVEGTQIKGGDTITVSCSVASIADSNPYGASGTMFAGTVFDAESEIIDAKDVSGAFEVTVGEDAITATVTTSQGEVELTAPEWIESPVNKKILTATLTGEKEGHSFELMLKLGEDGAFSKEESYLNVDKGTANEAVYGIQGKALLQEQDYEAALAGFGDYYTVDMQPVNADEDLTAKTDGDMQGFGGMSFEINRANGTVAYKGFLPDGTRFDGTARVHVETPEGEDPYLEFTIFAEAKKGAAGTGQWVGCLNRISLTAVTDGGDKEICITCTNTLIEPQSHPVWYRNEGTKQYMKSCGSIFDRLATLSEQLSTPPDNRYYLMVDKPPKLLNGAGEAVISPRRLIVAEDEEKRLGSGDSLFGVALAYNVARQGQGTGDDNIDYGEFEGTIDLYSLGFGENKKQTVDVHGILVSASQFCCSSEIHPVGLGYYQLTETINNQEVTTSYPVKLYWAKSLEDKDAVDDYLGEASGELKPSKANGKDLPEGAAESGLNVSGLAEGGAALEFSEASDVLAFSDDGDVEIFASNEAVSLGGGHWTLRAVDLSGEKGEGTPLALTVSADVALSLSLKPGWNLIGVPATVVSLAFDSEAALMQYSLFTQEKSAVVIATAPLTPGSAYWVYAQEEAELQLAGELDATIEPTLPASGKLYFGADPGAEKRDGGWIWKDGGFVEAEEENPSQGGWWIVK